MAEGYESLTGLSLYFLSVSFRMRGTWRGSPQAARGIRGRPPELFHMAGHRKCAEQRSAIGDQQQNRKSELLNFAYIDECGVAFVTEYYIDLASVRGRHLFDHGAARALLSSILRGYATTPLWPPYWWVTGQQFSSAPESPTRQRRERPKRQQGPEACWDLDRKRRRVNSCSVAKVPR
jgi:hypothetical protein